MEHASRGRYSIRYVDRYSGKAREHNHIGTPDSAKGWGQRLSKENSCRTQVVDKDTGRTLSTIEKGDYWRY
jgi:hypothetical protein